MDFTQALGILQSRSKAKVNEGGECVDCSGEVPDLEPSPPTVAGELDALTLGELLRLLLARQEERVGVYRRFEEGFVSFLQFAEAAGYQALATATTARFAEVSLAINAIEEQLRSREGAAAALASMIRRLQTLEKEKLTLTAQQHILRHG